MKTVSLSRADYLVMFAETFDPSFLAMAHTLACREWLAAWMRGDVNV